MGERVTIDRRFRGPPESGNGGYVCGLVAGFIDGAAEVTLRLPPPLDYPLEVHRLNDGAVAVRDGKTVIAEGTPTSVELEIPESVTFPEAETASKSYLGFRHHFWKSCFVCAPHRAKGDGLHIFPGWVERRGIVAAPWTPDTSLAGENGIVRSEFIWASLDCPGAWALFAEPNEGPTIMLGRLAAELVAPVQAGERYVAIGWPLGEDGRKLYSGTALFSADGNLHAFARATWIRTQQSSMASASNR